MESIQKTVNNCTQIVEMKDKVEKSKKNGDYSVLKMNMKRSGDEKTNLMRCRLQIIKNLQQKLLKHTQGVYKVTQKITKEFSGLERNIEDFVQYTKNFDLLFATDEFKTQPPVQKTQATQTEEQKTITGTDKTQPTQNEQERAVTSTKKQTDELSTLKTMVKPKRKHHRSQHRAFERHRRKQRIQLESPHRYPTRNRRSPRSEQSTDTRTERVSTPSEESEEELPTSTQDAVMVIDFPNNL